MRVDEHEIAGSALLGLGTNTSTTGGSGLLGGMGLCHSRAWPACEAKGAPITSATVQAVLEPMAAMRGGRHVQATVLSAELSNGKRKRRAPGWLEGHAQGDTDQSDQVSEAGSVTPAAPLLSPRPSQVILDRKRGKRSRSPAVNVVHATMVDSRHASPTAGVRSGGAGAQQYAVTILGITSPPVNELRQKAERSPPTPNPTSAERSPRMRASEPKRPNCFSEEDAFEVDFGALASPRIVELAKPKEVLLPSWRIVKAGGPRRRAAADAGDSSDEDTSDAVYLDRHTRCLAAAVAEAAAREAAFEAAQASRARRSDSS